MPENRVWKFTLIVEGRLSEHCAEWIADSLAELGAEVTSPEDDLGRWAVISEHEDVTKRTDSLHGAWPTDPGPSRRGTDPQVGRETWTR